MCYRNLSQDSRDRALSRRRDRIAAMKIPRWIVVTWMLIVFFMIFLGGVAKH
jgi:hypothetical protein